MLKLGFALAGAQASDLAYIVRFGMAEAYRSAGELGQRGRRRAARSLVAEYYQARLGELLERAREGLDGGLDVFVADEALTQYARAKHALAKYCWGRGTGGHVEHVAIDLELDPLEQHPIDWWALGRARDRQ